MSAARATARAYVAIAVLVALAVLFGSLGRWQLERAAESRSTLERYAAGGAEQALTGPPAALDDGARFRRLEVSGEIIAEPQFLLDNMLHAGVSGYHVLTAARLPETRERLIVNRGWVATGGDRRVLPDVTVSGGTRWLAGRIERLPRPGLRLGGEPPPGRAAGTVVVQYPTAGELSGLLGEPVHDYQLLLDPMEPDGYVREWRAPALPPERHLGYAGQWFALAIGALSAALVMAVKTVRRAA